MDEDTKTCYRCGKVKPVSEFGQDRKAKDGLHSWCKECVRKYQRAYRLENGDRLRARARAVLAANRKKQPGQQRLTTEEQRAYKANYYLQRKFGITLADYDEMLEAQGNGCAICGMTPEENGKRLCVDHDHETGRVRGLLCDGCNTGLGRFRDNPASLRSAASYIETT